MGAPNPTVKSVSDIKRFIMQPALTSHYECYFPYPSGVEKFFSYSGLTNTSEISRSLIISCSDASLPGSSLSTHELNNDFTGVTQRHAYRRLYDNQSDFSFYVDYNYTQIALFESWMRFIVGEQISDADRLNKSYRVSYPKAYKTSIFITKFERNIGKSTKTQSKKIVYSFFNAFPITVNSMPISYESSQLLKITVGFTYDRYVASNASIVGSYGEPGQTTSYGVPESPFDLTAFDQAKLNTELAFNQNINLGNYSPGTFTNTNTNFSDIFDTSDPTRVFQQSDLNQLSSKSYSSDLNLF